MYKAMVKDSNKDCGQGNDQTSISDNTFGGQCRDQYNFPRENFYLDLTNDLSALVTIGRSAEKTKAHLSIHAIVWLLDEMKTKFPLIFTIATSKQFDWDLVNE